VVSAVGQVAILVPLGAGVVADRAGVTTALLLYVAMAVVFAVVNSRDRVARARGAAAHEALRSSRG
jgi:hypothetical protein